MNDLNRSIKIFIDGTEASAGVKKIEDAISQLENKISSLDKSESGYARKSKTLQKELENKYKTLNTYKQKVAETDRILKNLSGATYDELLSVSQKVRKELRAAIPGTEQYNAALEQNRRVAEAVARAQKNMRVEVGCQASPIGKAVELFNKYAAVVTTVIAAVTGLTLKLNQLREKRNEREDAKADVEALTGLSKDDINWLEQEAIRLSTTISDSGIRIRQSATEILDAYKLVGSAKPELLSNKEALAAVTEQTLILASASGMTLKDAVDAVTLSLNQYGDGADQAARYANVMAAGSKYGAAAVESVTTAVKKSGVAANDAGIPIEQLVGTIETLAEKGIKDEVAGTGLKTFFNRLQKGADDTNPKIVGLETALENLQKKQLSVNDRIKMFGEEAFSVATVLTNEAEKVKYYTEAVTGTNVALEQAATKSDTAAAKLAQAKNKMNEMGMELMEKLNPSIISVINGTVNWTRKIIDLIGFMVKHSGIIITLTTTIGAYLLTIKAITIWETKLKDAKIASILADKLWETRLLASIAIEKAGIAVKALLTGNTVALNTAMKSLWKTIGLNPLAGTIALLAGLAVGIYHVVTARKTLSTAQEAANKISLEASKNTSEETNHLKSLKEILFDSKKSYGERQWALEEIQKIVPDYHASLTKEGELINNNTGALDGYVEKLLITAKQQAANAKLQEALNERTEWFSKQSSSEAMKFKSIEWDINDPINSNKSLEEIAASNGVSPTAYRAWASKKSQLDENVKLYEDMMRGYTEEIAKVNSKYQNSNNDNDGNDDGNGDSDEEKIKKRLEKEKKLYNQKQAFLKEMYLEGGDDTLQTEKQLSEEMECLQMEYLERSLKIVGEKSKEGINIQNQINDLKIKQQKEHNQELINELINQETTQYEKQQQDLKELYASGKDENLSSETAYNDAMEQLTIMHLERMLSIAGLNAEQRKQVEKQLLDFKIKCMKEEQAAHAKAKDAEQKKTAAQTQKERQQYKERLRTFQQYGSELGSALGNIIAGQENAMQGFADVMIDIIFDVLAQMINAKIIELTAVGTENVAKATANEIGSKGFLGIGTGAILGGIIMAAIATAKSALKGMVSGKHSSGTSDSDTSSTDAPKRATVSVSQWASGRYDVIGKDDGKNYQDIPYIGAAQTGIVRHTSLVSENGAELIINAEDLSRLQKHINYPLVLNAIEDARKGHVPQRASGNYAAIDTPVRNNQEIHETDTSATELDKLIKEIGMLINTLKNLKAYVSLRDIRNAEELDEKSKKPFTRSTK